jgi:hypothetical protein
MTENIDLIGEEIDYPLEVIRQRNRKVNEWREKVIDERLTPQQLFQLFDIKIAEDNFGIPIYWWNVKVRVRKTRRVHQYMGKRADSPPRNLVELRRKRVEQGLSPFSEDEEEQYEKVA